jgi:hypothetical protein
LSPDGTRIAVGSFRAGSLFLSVWDFGRNAWAARLSDQPLRDYPVWMPDGSSSCIENAGSVVSDGSSFQPADGGQADAISDDEVGAWSSARIGLAG